MNGKGIYIWKAANTGMTDPRQVAAICANMGLSWVAIKIGDGANIRYASFGNDQAKAVRAFKDVGIKVWGWQYIYGGIWIDKTGKIHTGGDSPSVEAAFAVDQVSKLGLDGYIIDAEREFKVANPQGRANEFAHGLHSLRAPIGLSSYRFPALHREFAWAEFLAVTDVHMPQVYWGPGRSVSDLDRSIKELTALKKIPVVPAGRAYIGDGHNQPVLMPKEMMDFMSRAHELKLPGCFFWALDFLYLHEGGEFRMDVIRQFPWGVTTTPTWSHAITTWARSLGYLGPGPEE